MAASPPTSTIVPGDSISIAPATSFPSPPSSSSSSSSSSSPSSISSSSSSFSKYAAIAGVAAVSVLSGVGLMYLNYRMQQSAKGRRKIAVETKPKKKKGPSEAASGEEKSGVAVAIDIESKDSGGRPVSTLSSVRSSALPVPSLPSDLLSRFQSSLAEMATTGKLDDVVCTSLRDAVHQLSAASASTSAAASTAISTPPPLHLDPKLILFAVRWISTYHELWQLHFLETVATIRQQLAEKEKKNSSTSIKEKNKAAQEAETAEAELEKAQLQMKLDSETDLEVCWRLVSAWQNHQSSNRLVDESGPTPTQRAVDVVALEMAQRLKSIEKMKLTYAKVKNNITQFENRDQTEESQSSTSASAAVSSSSSTSSSSPDSNVLEALTSTSVSPSDELTAAFLTAPLLGYWSDTYNFGRRLESSKPEIMRDFHLRCLHEVEQFFPDYSQIYSLAKQLVEASKKPTPDFSPAQLKFFNYDVTSVSIEMVALESPDAELNHILQAQFSMSPNRGQSQTIPFQPGALRFIRTGALARMVSPFNPVMPVVGICTDADFHLYGYDPVGTQSQDQSDPESESGWFEQESHGTLESKVNGGKELVFTGNATVRRFKLKGKQEKPEKGELLMTQKYKVEWNLKKTEN